MSSPHVDVLAVDLVHDALLMYRGQDIVGRIFALRLILVKRYAVALHHFHSRASPPSPSQIFICHRVSDADAILGLRPRMRTASALRQVCCGAFRVFVYGLCVSHLGSELQQTCWYPRHVAAPSSLAMGF